MQDRTAGSDRRFDKNSTAADVLAGIDLTGRKAIATGASSGVGIALAQALAAAGAEVTLAVRNIDAGREVADKIATEAKVRRPSVQYLDLLSLHSIRALVRAWGDRPLDMLINNAGLMGLPFTLTEDGFESQMAVNFFGPFLLTKLLLPNLLAAAPARMVIVSSGAHHLADFDLDDLNYARRPYDRFAAYGDSKFAANLFAVGFAHGYAAQGVTAFAVTPGGVATNLGRHSTFEDAVRLGWVNADGSLPQGEMKSPEQGAATAVWAAVAPELEGRGGLYLEDCAIAPNWEPPMPPGWRVRASSLDPVAADRLWGAAERLTES